MRARKQTPGPTEVGRYTYHEDMGVVDCQDIFDAIIPNGHDMYSITTGATSKPTIFDRSTIANRLKTVKT